MKIHRLKADGPSFDAIRSGEKKCDIRFDDRGFEVGDMLHLRKTKYTGEEMANSVKVDGGLSCPLQAVGKPYDVRVTHILRGPAYGLKEGWVCLSITD